MWIVGANTYPSSSYYQLNNIAKEHHPVTFGKSFRLRDRDMKENHGLKNDLFDGEIVFRADFFLMIIDDNNIHSCTMLSVSELDL